MVVSDYSTHFLVLLTALLGGLAIARLASTARQIPRSYLRAFQYKLLTELLGALLTVGFIIYLGAHAPAGSSVHPVFWFLFFVIALLMFTIGVYYQSIASLELLSRPRPPYLNPLLAIATAIGLLIIGIEFARKPVDEETLPIRVFFYCFSATCHAWLLWLSGLLIRRGWGRTGTRKDRALAAAGWLLGAVSMLWVVTVVLGVAHLLPVRLYQAFNLSRTILLSVAVIFYLDRFVEGVERAVAPSGSTGEILPSEFLVRYQITEREADVLDLVCQGYSNQEIGERLFIAVPTVKSHLHNVFRKTGVRNRVQLVNLIQST